MRTIVRFLTSSFLGVVAGLAGLVAGAAIGLAATLLYYIARILLSLEPYTGAKPDNIISAILDSAGFGLWAMAIGAAIGGLAGFSRAFGRLFSRRTGMRDFLKGRL